ncbi:hypothetical protein CH359_02800 [Leptospira meyeri]|nr:hypothetical protein CH359_02800 [Leptospira meyeri]
MLRFLKRVSLYWTVLFSCWVKKQVRQKVSELLFPITHKRMPISVESQFRNIAKYRLESPCPGNSSKIPPIPFGKILALIGTFRSGIPLALYFGFGFALELSFYCFVLGSIPPKI